MAPAMLKLGSSNSLSTLRGRPTLQLDRPVASPPGSPQKSTRSMLSLRDQLVAASAPDSPKNKNKMGFMLEEQGATSPTCGASKLGQAQQSTLGRKRLPQFHQSQFYTKPFDLAYADLAKARNLKKLEVLFLEADADGSGEMSFTEFREALRIPRIQRAFSVLGVQPHQSEPIFTFLDKKKTGELSITVFMEGLADLVGTDMDGTGKELDVETLRPSYKAKIRYHSHYQPPVNPMGLATKRFSRTGINSATNLSTNLDLGPVHLLPQAKVQRAFVHSASAQALHAATSLKK